MFALAILFASTLLEETSESLGKKSVRKRQETVSNLAFLTLFWTVIFLAISILLGAKFQIKFESLPFLAIRVFVEITLGYTAATAIVRSDRSTINFMRTLTIPLVLATDVILGYHLTSIQISGICVMFAGLAAAFFRDSTGRKGSGLGILVACLSAVAATLYKWDITHYNSVAAEQLVVYSFVVVFFYGLSCRRGGSPIKLLLQPATGFQSLTNGLGLAIEAFSWVFAPASIIVTLKRSLAVMWSIIFGHHYFHEHKLKKKAFAGAVLVVGLVMLVSPYL